MILVGPKPPGLNDLRTAARTVPRAFKLVWRAHPLGAAALALVTLALAGLPAAQAWVAKLIVDAVVLALNNGLPAPAGLERALPLVLIELILVALGAALAEARSLLQHILSARLRFSLNTALMRQALALDLSFFEDPGFYDRLQNARRETDFRAMTILETSFQLLQGAVTLASFAALLLAFSPLIALLLTVATVPALLAQMRYSDMFFHLMTFRAPEFRRMHYFEHLLTVDDSAKEVKLFGLGEPLLKRYHDLFWKFYREDSGLARRRAAMSLIWGLLATVSYYAAYAWIVWRAVAGTITLGDMTLYLTITRQAQATLQTLFTSAGQIYESGLFMENLFEFLGLRPLMPSSNRARPMPPTIVQGIEFRDVSFRYPRRSAWALRNISLRIAPGEKLALVGANGAGKTTLVKLLTRLYDPTEGQILLDGVDLREYNLDDLHRRIGVIFQDFVRYHATARENIGFGQIDALDDDARLAAAAASGGADEVVGALPHGYNTMLGAWFDTGHQLSGGQWQKIALGRAFMRDAEVLVLDEPTAALDAEREREIFQRFRELTEGKIALLVSHRFSTVRMADRIAVLEDGALAELGSHAELLALGGTYARLFNMQAEGYR